MTKQARTVKVSTAPVAANSPFKDVFGPAASERKQLINKIKGIREQRNALRGVAGTKDQWDSLTKEMHATQNRINELNVQLGIEVKTFPAPADKKPRNAQETGRARGDRKPAKHQHYKGRINKAGGVRRGDLYVITTETNKNS